MEWIATGWAGRGKRSHPHPPLDQPRQPAPAAVLPVVSSQPHSFVEKCLGAIAPGDARMLSPPPHQPLHPGVTSGWLTHPLAPQWRLTLPFRDGQRWPSPTFLLPFPINTDFTWDHILSWPLPLSCPPECLPGPSPNHEPLIPYLSLCFRELDLRQRGFLEILSKWVGWEWKEYSLVSDF